jgi:predicted patatin/cPLA2 family phospholipase
VLLASHYGGNLAPLISMLPVWMTPREITEPGVMPAALTAADPAALLTAPDDIAGSVLRIVLERARAASGPRDRADDHVVALAVEGGGLRGAVSAGMCVVLEAAGLVSAFDRIYGVSAGALNGAAAAVGQAALSATHYQDAVSHGVINRMRPLVGGSVIDFDLMFENLIAARKPLSFEGLSSGPEFRALATSLETFSLRVLRDFADVDEMMLAVRASSALPRLGGRPPVFRGERMADGGLIEPIPLETALNEGATHVLVLRSRPPGYRRPALRELGDSLAVRDNPALVDLFRARRGSYNRQAAELEHAPIRTRDGAHVQQVAVPDGSRLVGRLENNGERVTEALRLGAKAMASAIFTQPIDLCWQPVVYRATATPAAAAQPAGSPAALQAPVAPVAEAAA